MNKQLFSKIAIAILLLLPLSACHKFIDWKDVWDKNKPACRIEKMIFYPDFNPPRTGIFSYNQKGDPVSIIFDWTSTGYTDFMFLYDHKHRVTDYVAHYQGGGYQLWYSYQYDSRDRAISDTIYHFGNIVNGIPVPNPNYKFYGNYEYDAYGRVAKVVNYRVYPDTTVFTYTESYIYNSDGNLAAYRQTYPSGFYSEIKYDQYDNKVSLHQANKVWMFVDRNYSRNNQGVAEHYNSKGLPLKFDAPYAGFFLWDNDLRHSEIFYSCKN